ncbi:50S ribosomal protein L10 [Candidatus Kaiserbacteria bacterium CG10_big_fil_rev_8_21_14_0_10_59_10]|uniref:Large ribosomal subunit protein uL10 n=1 Tax=Candidatus Kaiserbacteria bacterium CG10_big_fil_rev_8_21_14_0_10_59_10 TaxID=1974612 RepID=A0A2H0U8M8_9BACT|nr:MAG: 50S ribosomal protein L10 [Candidatus Kaiserbacteria bacterium CG10_big_fil_rev_8_21_14_0_10_59_10]
MAKTREQKAELVQKLEDAFKSAASSVFVHFTGLSVSDESEVRRGLRAEGVRYFVAKKTLIRRALEKLGHKHEDVPLEGEVAIAYLSADAPAKAGGAAGDVTAPARLVHEFGNKFSGKLNILGGLFESRLVGQSEMTEIATIPPMQTLRGMFVNVINSPIQGLAVALNAIAEKEH